MRPILMIMWTTFQSFILRDTTTLLLLLIIIVNDIPIFQSNVSNARDPFFNAIIKNAHNNSV